eukprot:29815-Chlamydomonas_euryale.AAC.1
MLWLKNTRALASTAPCVTWLVRTGLPTLGSAWLCPNECCAMRDAQPELKQRIQSWVAQTVANKRAERAAKQMA